MEVQEVDFYNTLTCKPFDDAPKQSVIPTLDFSEEPLKEDLWGFNYFWPEVTRQFSSVEELYSAIQDLYEHIQKTKEKYREMALGLPEMQIERNQEGGVCGSYFLIDAEGKRRFIVKPLDEDGGCIHNKDFATPFTMSPFRDNIPLYSSSMREVLAYQVAEMIGVSSIIPKTQLGIIESGQFHDMSDHVAPREMKRFMDIFGKPDKEKLCSVQEYVQNAKSLFEAIHDLEMAGLSDEEIAKKFDQTDFEEANILLWTTYDTDGHMGNFLVYPKGADAIGNEILGLKKIDNGLAFPDKNRHLRNNLSFLPNAGKKLSEEAKLKILAIDVDALADQFEKMGLESAVRALKKRILFLKELANRQDLTIKEINQELSKIGKKR